MTNTIYDLDLLRSELSNRLTQLARELDVTIISPFVFTDELGQEQCYPVFFPKFGSPKGILVDVLEALDSNPSLRTRTVGRDRLKCSFVNLLSIREDGIHAVMEMLTDWGYFGDTAGTPKFLKGSG